jgi:hypothetical protein
MSLKEELLKRTPRATSGTYSKGKCGFTEWVKNKEEETILELVELLEDKAISSNSMYNFLKKTYPDISFGLTTFKRHRNRECLCP